MRYLMENTVHIKCARRMPGIPSTQEAKAGGPRRDQGQPGIHRETLSEKKKKNY
jgi:cytochrome c5